MNQPSYHPDTSPAFTEYAFESWGPQGIFPYLITYTYLPDMRVYNLCFGRRTIADTIDDTHNNSNGDRDLILATVVKSAYVFTNNYPDRYIVFKGSTPGRTRLYRMLLSIYFHELSRDFNIWGLLENLWVDFAPNTAFQYEAYMVQRRTPVFFKEGIN